MERKLWKLAGETAGEPRRGRLWIELFVGKQEKWGKTPFLAGFGVVHVWGRPKKCGFFFFIYFFLMPCWIFGNGTFQWWRDPCWSHIKLRVPIPFFLQNSMQREGDEAALLLFLDGHSWKGQEKWEWRKSHSHSLFNSSWELSCNSWALMLFYSSKKAPKSGNIPARKVLGWIFGNIYSWKMLPNIGRGSQGRGGILIPGGI